GDRVADDGGRGNEERRRQRQRRPGETRRRVVRQPQRQRGHRHGQDHARRGREREGRLEEGGERPTSVGVGDGREADEPHGGLGERGARRRRGERAQRQRGRRV